LITNYLSKTTFEGGQVRKTGKRQTALTAGKKILKKVQRKPMRYTTILQMNIKSFHFVKVDFMSDFLSA
jgi:hypothetical protein